MSKSNSSGQNDNAHLKTCTCRVGGGWPAPPRHHRPGRRLTRTESRTALWTALRPTERCGAWHVVSTGARAKHSGDWNASQTLPPRYATGLYLLCMRANACWGGCGGAAVARDRTSCQCRAWASAPIGGCSNKIQKGGACRAFFWTCSRNRAKLEYNTYMYIR